MCCRWEQQLFMREVSVALMAAKDIIKCPKEEITPILPHIKLGGVAYVMCFITRQRTNNHLEELHKNSTGSSSARLENFPRMNSHTVSVLTHFGIPCAVLLYARMDIPTENLPSVSPPAKELGDTRKPTEALLQLLELLVYTAASQVNMTQICPFVIQIPICQQKQSVAISPMSILKGWYKSTHMAGIMNGMNLSSSFGTGEMKSYDSLQGSDENSCSHNTSSLSSAHALTLLRDAKNAMRYLSKYSNIGPIPLLSCYYTEILANTSDSMYITPALPYNACIVRRMDPLQRVLSFSDLKDFVSDALGRSKSQRHIAARNSPKVILASLTKSLRMNADEILWPLTDTLPTDVNKNIYVNNIYQDSSTKPIKSQLNVTLSRILPLDFPLTAHVPRMYLNSIATNISNNFGCVWKIFAGLPPEAFLRGKAIESVVLHCYATDFEQDFPVTRAAILRKVYDNLDNGSSVSFLNKGNCKSNVCVIRKTSFNESATNINTAEYRQSPSEPITLTVNNYEDTYLTYIKKLTDYRQARALEYKRNKIIVGDTTISIPLPAGIPLRNSLQVLSLAIHFGLAVIESFGAEAADIDDAPVWAFTALFEELSRIEDFQKAVSGCAAVVNIFSIAENCLGFMTEHNVGKNLDAVSIDYSISISSNFSLAALVTMEEQLTTPKEINRGEKQEIFLDSKALDNIIDYIIGRYRGTNTDASNHYYGRRRRAPLKMPPYYSSQLSKQFYDLHSKRYCPEGCLLCRIAGIIPEISDSQGALVVIKMLFLRLIEMFSDGETIPYIDYTFDIINYNIIYQTMVKANQCLKLYQASTNNASSMSFDDRGRTPAGLGLNILSLSFPSPTFYDLECELSKDPQSTVLYSLVCKNFIYFLLQTGARFIGDKLNEEVLVKGMLEHMIAHGKYAGYAPNDLVSIYPLMCKQTTYTDHPFILTSEALDTIPIDRKTGELTFVPKANSTKSTHASYLCLIYPYPNSFVEQCARVVVRKFLTLNNDQQSMSVIDRLYALRKTASDIDFYDIGLQSLRSILTSEGVDYIMYMFASIRVINYIIEVSEIGFETINGIPLFDALLDYNYSSVQEDKDTKYNHLAFPTMPTDGLLLSPIEVYRTQATLRRDLSLTTMKNNLSLLKKMCAQYYRQEYVISCSSLLSEILGVQLSLAYTMCLQSVALDPGERDLAFKRIEKHLVPLFWEATLITNFSSGDVTQYHRCYMQFLKPDLSRHLFTPTFRHCVGFTLCNAVFKSKM